jgi:hypothetical protein
VAGRRKEARYNQPHVVREAKISREQSTAASGPMAWRFSEVDQAGPYRWRITDDAKFREVMEKLHDLEGKTPDEIKNGGSHVVQVADLSLEARSRLVEVKLDELTELMSFRLTGTNRVWCFQRTPNHIMRILWWDERHEVCPTKVDRADRIKDRIKRGR